MDLPVCVQGAGAGQASRASWVRAEDGHGRKGAAGPEQGVGSSGRRGGVPSNCVASGHGVQQRRVGAQPCRKARMCTRETHRGPLLPRKELQVKTPFLKTLRGYLGAQAWRTLETFMQAGQAGPPGIHAGE